jgi:hypothetical protein
MRPHLIKIIAGLTSFVSYTYAVSPVEGIYVGGIFGGTYQHNVHGTVNSNTILNELSIPSTAIPSLVANQPISSTLGYQMLVDGGGQIGFRFCENFRLELEGLYNKNPYNFLSVGNFTIYNNSSSTAGFRIDGSTSSGLGIVNFYYDFLGDGSNSLVPYIGGGGGYAYIYNVTKIFYNGTLVTPNQQSVKTQNSTFVGQAIIGASYFMDDFFSVSVDARYYATPTQQFTTNFGVTQNMNMQVYSVNMLFNGVLELG